MSKKNLWTLDQIHERREADALQRQRERMLSERTNLFCPSGKSWMCKDGGLMLVRDVEEDIRCRDNKAYELCGNNYKCTGCGNKFYIEVR